MESEHAEENLSTEQPPPREKARIQGEDGDEEWPGRTQASPCKGPQAIDGSPLLSFGLPKEVRLLKRADFLRVYNEGVRFEGRFMTVFILSVNRPNHRVGVTATKKAIGSAVARNRAKRLLRESFRLNRGVIDVIDRKYDWVLNARRSLIHAKLDKPLGELREIAQRIATIDVDAIVERKHARPAV